MSTQRKDISESFLNALNFTKKINLSLAFVGEKFGIKSELVALIVLAD